MQLMNVAVRGVAVRGVEVSVFCSAVKGCCSKEVLRCSKELLQ